MGFFETLLSSTTNIIFLVLITGVFFTSLYFSKKGKAGEFVNYAPTLLTTLGIFGTFFGIVLGLMEFNQNNIEASIPPLLSGLKTAFFTSLAGMLSSLLLKTLSTTPLLKPKQVEASVDHASPEMILATMQAQLKATQTLQESLVGNEESTLFGQLKIMRGDVNDQMKMSRNQSNDNFAKQQEQVVEFSDKLWLKLQDFADTLSKSATEQVIDALKQVIVDFNNNLTEQFGENFKQLNEAVFKLVEWQELYKLQLEQMNQQYEQGVQAITATESSVAHISEKTLLIPQAMNDLQDVMTVNQHQLSELESHLEAFKDMRDRAVEAVPEIRRQVEETVTDISAAVTTANSHYQKLLTESDSYIQNHIETSQNLLEKFVVETEKGIDTVGTRLTQSSEVIGTTIDTAATEFTHNAARTNESLQTSSDYLQTQTEAIKQHLTDTVSDLNNTVRDMIEKLVVDAQSMNKTMHDANQNLVSDTSDVRDVMLKSTEQLQKQLGEVIENAATQQVNQARKTFEAMEEQIRQQVGLTGEAVENQLSLIDKTMQQEVSRVMTEMGQALAQVTGKFTADYIKLTQAMSEVVRQQAA